MPTTPRVIFTFAFVTAALLATPSPSRATWQLNGNPICTAPGAQSNARCAPDGTGGAVILWTDERRGAGLIDLYGTRVRADGTIAPGWPTDGVELTSSGDASWFSIVGDGAGGLLAFWLDAATAHAFVQHVGADGTLAPGFGTGGIVLPIAVGGPSGHVLQAVTDGAGGAYVMWNRFNGAADAIYLTRVSGTGAIAPGWTASGVQQAYGDPANPLLGFAAVTIGADPGGGALTGALWDVNGGGLACTFTRTGPDGGAPALYAGVTSVASGPSLVADGAGGMFASWTSTSAPLRCMQHFLADGQWAWPSPTAAPWSDDLLLDGSGGIYLFGHSPSPDQLVLSRRDASASIPPPWTAAGVVVSSAGTFTTFGAVCSGDLVYTAWSNGAAGANDVRACAVTPAGAIAPGWVVNGNVVCNATGTQILTSMIALPPTDALVAWADTRSGGPDVYATRLYVNGPPTLAAPPSPLPGTISLALAPDPAGALARVSFALPEPGPAAVEVLDLAGRVLVRVEVEARGGPQSLALDTARLPGGLYWARLRQAGRTTASRFAVVH